LYISNICKLIIVKIIYQYRINHLLQHMFAKLSPQRAIDLRVSLDILFIEEYMPHSPENFLKVYLYGLALCSHNIEHDNSLEKIAKRLSVDTQTILSAYDYWQEQGLINVLPTVPISVEYLPIKDSSTNYRKKFNKDKYADFNKQLQHMLPSRQIMQNEYLEYYSAIENLHMQPEAMLSIISYCVRLKGIEIGFKYILKALLIWNGFVFTLKHKRVHLCRLYKQM